MIVAHGIDVVDIAHSQKLLDAAEKHWLARCFTSAEQAEIPNHADRAARLSARFAIKEAVMKALGTGFGKGIGFLAIETFTNENGAPAVRLYGEAAKRAEALGIEEWLVSTSHEGNIAMASVLALSDHRPR